MNLSFHTITPKEYGKQYIEETIVIVFCIGEILVTYLFP